MPRKPDPFWKEIRPLWWAEIKLWFGWTDWVHAILKTGIQLGGLWFAFYLTGKVEDFIGSLAVELGKVVLVFLFIFPILFITYTRASNKLYQKQKTALTKFSKEIRGEKLWTKPEISFETRVSDDFSDNVFYWNVRLVVHNNEDIDLTDCYATLTHAADYLEEQQAAMQDPKIKKDRLRWSKSGYSNDNCEITIPLTDSREVNLVHTKRNFEYLLCGKTVSANIILGTRLYIVKIRIDGKFNGKSIQPQYFDGYIYYDGTRLRNYKFEDTRNGEIMGSGEGSILDPYMLFEKGDWTQDDRIPIPRPDKNNVKNEEKRKTTQTKGTKKRSLH